MHTFEVNDLILDYSHMQTNTQNVAILLGHLHVLWGF